MVVFGENWNPSETVRLTARILAKQKIHPERTPSEKLLAVKEFESRKSFCDWVRNYFGHTFNVD